VSATGTVDEVNHTIAVTVPYGTSVTNLVATFTTTGQTVKVGSTVQASGVTANNFSSPVTYTVVAADSSTQNYVVTVTPEPAPQMLVQIEGPTDVPSGTGVVIFGPINTRQTVSKTFWIYNKGPAGSYLRLTGGVQVSGTDAARFAPSYSFPSPIASNSYVTFTVVFSPDVYSAPKLCSASVSIASNDPTKNPYTFALKGNMWFRTYDVHGTTGTGSGQFSGPQAVAYNPVNSSVYVVDRMREKVLIFNSAGSFVSEFGPATGNGCLALPESVAIDSSGNVYVGSTAEQIDAGFHYVQKFDKDGNWLTGWGSYGAGNGQFAEVNGIAVGPGSEVYVSDRWNNRVEVFSSAGAYSRSWYVSEPLGIYVFSGGLVLVWTQSGIEEYDGTGTYQGEFGMGSYGPYLACDEFRDHVFATDNTSIRIYDFFGVLEGDLRCAGLFAAQIGGMAFGNGYLYFVNNDWGDPANNGNNALVRVQEYTAVP
jgi:hypothetical protein